MAKHRNLSIKIDNLKEFILLINQQLSEPIDCKITNIKLSFTNISTNIEIEFDDNICISYYSNYILVAKFDDYTYTFLGKNKEHLNITGIKSFSNIEKAISALPIFSNLEICNFKYFTIDNISTTFKTHPGLRQILQTIKESDFKILVPHHFCGIIIKYNRFSLTYFNSGAVILVGLKNISDLNLCVKKYISFFDYCLTLEKLE